MEYKLALLFGLLIAFRTAVAKEGNAEKDEKQNQQMASPMLDLRSSTGLVNCGSHYCYNHQVCCPNRKCCSAGNVCCGNYCCVAGQHCCGAICCTGQCCSMNTCCPAGTYCIGGGQCRYHGKRSIVEALLGEPDA